MAFLRLSALFLLGLGVTTLVAAPASANCCALDYMVVDGPNMDPIEIDGEPFVAGLETWERGLLPVFSNRDRTEARPSGTLGPGYLVEYVLHRARGGYALRFREMIYPEAQLGPVAYVFPGQVAQIAPTDKPRQVDPGWRPFPAARAILDAIAQGSRSTPWEPPVLWLIPTLMLAYWSYERARDPYLSSGLAA